MIGTLIESALSSVGITKERVERWVGGPCGCEERREKLDAITRWSKRVLAGKVERAREYLDRIMGEQ